MKGSDKNSALIPSYAKRMGFRYSEYRLIIPIKIAILFLELSNKG